MSRAFLKSPLPYLLIILVLASCGSYKKNIMFRVDPAAGIQKQVAEAEANYVIQQNDQLTIQVYTSEGERLIDPDFRLTEENRSQAAMARPNPSYLVDIHGKIKFPMVGEIQLEGLTLRQAEQILQKEFSRFYQQPYVLLQYQSKRVIVLGAPGGQVIPLQNDNIRLTEILALAGGVSNDGNAQNIRVLRGEHVILADMSTFEGYRQNNIVMEPGDVVYVEPVRRPVVESIRDFTPIVTIITSLTTLIVVLLSL